MYLEGESNYFGSWLLSSETLDLSQHVALMALVKGRVCYSIHSSRPAAICTSVFPKLFECHLEKVTKCSWLVAIETTIFLEM